MAEVHRQIGEATVGPSSIDAGWVQIMLPSLAWTVHILLGYGPGDRPVVLGFSLDPKAGFREITPAALRSLPFDELRSIAAAYLAGDFDRVTTAAERAEDIRPVGKAWPDDHYARVAEEYRRAVLRGDPPLPAIQERWSISRPMASKYVRRARDLGFLAEPERPGVAWAEIPPKSATKRTTRKAR